jgi:hypothetical protein
VDFYFDNTIIFIAFVVVALITLISLAILGRDLVMFIVRRMRKREGMAVDTSRRKAVEPEGEDFR